MTKIQEVVAVPLSAGVTQEHILKYFESRRGGDGTIKIPLRVSLHDFGLPDTLAIERDVEVRVEKRRDAENINEEIAVNWLPVDGGPFPTLSGRLIVWSEQRPDESFVQLDGTYEPPLGAAGEFFDAAVGYLIAERTAHAFLTDLSAAVVAMQKLTAKQ